MANGVSGFVPPGYRPLVDRLGRLDAPALEEIARMPIDALVLHRQLLPQRFDISPLEASGFKLLWSSADDLVYGSPSSHSRPLE
jgi:hypothetical protein